jgi:hypothetical protein
MSEQITEAAGSEGDGGPGRSALQAMYWRSEILQVMVWMRGEGFGEEVDTKILQRFLGVDADTGLEHLDGMVKDGYVVRVGDRYRLSELGQKEGALDFIASFEELQRTAHGECGPDCPHCFPPEGVDSDCTEACPAYELAMEGRSV